MNGAQVGAIYVAATINTKEYEAGKKRIEQGNSELAGDSKKTGGALSSTLVRGFKMATLAGIAFTTAVSLKGGISRALNIEDAKAKLKGLGHDTEAVKTIMDNALASVKGTAFGLGDAATVSASAVAAGIKPGQQLEQVLKTVANSAAVAGTDMGSMGDIFNKVASTGKVSGRELQQLGAQGVPVLQFLAKELGVTAEEASKMVSQGKVDFATFERAMREGVGDAADEMGKTTRGQFDNMKAALSRLGEVAVNEMLPGVKIGLSGVTGFVDGLTNSLKDMLKWTKDNSESVGLLASIIGGMAAPILAVKGAILLYNIATKAAKTAQLLWNAALAANPIMLIISLIAGLVAGLIYFFTQTETGRKIFSNFWTWLKTSVSSVKTKVITTFQNLWTGVKNVFSNVGGFFSGIVTKIVGAFTGIGGRLKSMFTKGLAAIKSINWFQLGADIVAGIAKGLNPASVIGKMKEIASSALGTVKKFLGIRSPSRVMMKIGEYIGTGMSKGILGTQSQVKSVMKKIADTASAALKAKDISKSGYEAIVNKINTSNKKLQKLALERTKILDKIKEKKDYAKSLSGQLSTASVSGEENKDASSFIKNLKDQLTQTNALKTTLEQLRKMKLNKTTYEQLAQGGLGSLELAQSIAKGGKSSVNQINSLQTKLTSTSKSIGNAVASELYDAGVNAAKGLAKGLEQQRGRIEQQMKKIAQSIQTTAKKALKIKSPSRVMRDEIGKMVGAGLAKGVDASVSKVESASSSLANSLVRPFDNSNRLPELAGYDKILNLGDGEGKKTEIHIQKIEIADRQTADYFIRRLSNDQEITSAGLIPNQKYAGA